MFLLTVMPHAVSVGQLAQLGEHLVYTERVGGSIPSPPTISGFVAGDTLFIEP